MPRKAIKERPVTIPEVKKILESIGEEHLDQFQRRSLDYATKFSKTDSDVSEELVKKLIEDFDLEVEEAVQIVNCMPTSMEELRVFLGGGRRIVDPSRMEAILTLLFNYRREE